MMCDDLEKKADNVAREYEGFVKLVDSSEVVELKLGVCTATDGAPAPFYNVIAHKGAKQYVW